MEQIWMYLKTGLLVYGSKVIYALIALLAGLWVVKSIVKLFDKALISRKIDVSLKGFLKSFLGISLKTLLVVSVITMVGIQMTSFIAILGAAGFAVGMALSGMLQNFAGRVMIMIFKPFIGVVELADSSVNFAVRLWVEAPNYWDVYFYMQETVKKTFDKKGISIPFPQRDVHLYETPK